MKREELVETNVALSTIHNKAVDIKNHSRDYLVSHPSKNMWMDDSGAVHFTDIYGVSKSASVNPWSLFQFGSTIHKSSLGGYLNDCFEEGLYDLAADNFNHWLEHNEVKKTIQLRTFEDTSVVNPYDLIRGVVSKNYSVFDSHEITEVLGNVMPDDKWDIKGSYLNESRMHLRFVGRDILSFKDPLFPAIFVDSSDVGRCSLRVQFGIYRLACTNGLIIPAVQMMYHKRHLGIQKLDFVAELTSTLTNLPVMVSKAEDMIKAAQNKRLNLLDQTDIDEIVKDIRLRTKMSKKDAEAVIGIQKAAYDNTQWGLVNAITEYAHRVSVDERVALENAAGLMLAAA